MQDATTLALTEYEVGQLGIFAKKIIMPASEELIIGSTMIYTARYSN